jgi:superfamily I DNA/RNA helicase
LAGVSQLTIRYEELQSELARLGQLSVADLFADLFPAGNLWAEPIRELVTGKMDEVEDAGGLLDLLRTEITQPEVPAEGDFVRIMSLHKSKGLTSRVTIIVGCIHGLIPFVDSDLPAVERPAHLQEQRRVFYVALTRAKEILVVSSVASIPRAMSHQIGAVLQGGNAQHGNTIACQFLHELGPQAPAASLGADWAAARFR